MGDISDLKLEDKSIDLIILSQAFHHILDSVKLLKGISRVLKPSGTIIIVGEHYYGFYTKVSKVIRHFVKFIINYKGYQNGRTLIPDFAILFPSDYYGASKGDMHYSKFQYHQLFTGIGFKYKRYIYRDVQGFYLFNESQ